MIRIKRVQITYDRLPLTRRQAAILSREVMAQVQKQLQDGPTGTVGRLAPPTIRVSSNRAGKPEIVRRAAGAVHAELARRLRIK